MQYNGTVLMSFHLLKNGDLTRNIDCKFQDDELEWLKEIAIEGNFTITSNRGDGAVHDFRIAIDAPISPTNFGTDRVRLLIKLNGIEWNSSQFAISARVQNADEQKLSKAFSLYSMV